MENNLLNSKSTDLNVNLIKKELLQRIQFYEDLQDLLELTPQEDVLFIIGDWNAKVGSQVPGVTGRYLE